MKLDMNEISQIKIINNNDGTYKIEYSLGCSEADSGNSRDIFNINAVINRCVIAIDVMDIIA